MARPRTLDIAPDGTCRKCGKKAVSNGTHPNGRQKWKPHYCGTEVTKAERAKRAHTKRELSLFFASIVDAKKPSLDTRMRAARHMLDYELYEPEPELDRRKVSIEIVEDSNVLEED